MNTHNHPKISVIIPSYNHANFIGEAIDSVLNQTYKSFELIIVDDCSTDNSADIISAHPDPRIRFYRHEKNMGAVYTTNELIKLAGGEYIALLNSDDLWERGKLQIQVNILDNSPSVGAVFSDALFVNEKGDALQKDQFMWANIFGQANRSSGKWLRRFFFELNCLCHPSILIRKSIYDNTDLYNSCFRQLPDFLMWTNVLKFTSIHIIDKKLVRFRIMSSNDNVSADTYENRIRNINEISLIMQNFFHNMPDNVFIDGFEDLLINKGTLTAEQIQCEQAFVFFRVQSDIAHVYHHIGIKKMYDLLQDQKMREVLASDYSFTENDFFRLTGTHDTLNFANIKPSPLPEGSIASLLRRAPMLYSAGKYIYHKCLKRGCKNSSVRH